MVPGGGEAQHSGPYSGAVGQHSGMASETMPSMRIAGGPGRSSAVFTADQAEAVAEAVYGEQEPLGVLPADEQAATRAIAHLAGLLDGISPLVRRGLVGAEQSAAQLSADRLQGLIEIIQNADDLGATQVRFQLAPRGRQGQVDLLAAHDGAPVRLPDVMGMAVPWLSLKAQDAAATGRFGIGLMTLRSLGPDLHVHSGHLHFGLRAVTLTPLTPREPPAALAMPDATLMVAPVQAARVSQDDITSWFRGWDDASLLFLRHVRRVLLFDGHGQEAVRLELFPEPEERLPDGGLARREVVAGDGRRWTVYRTEMPVPEGERRFNKAAAETTSLAVALPQGHEDGGWLHAGLPVRAVDLPFRVAGQFDPLTNRRDIADLPWNAWLLGAVGSLWADAALHQSAQSPSATWSLVPDPAVAEEPGWLEGDVGQTLQEALRSGVRSFGARYTLQVDGQRLGLADLAVEEPALTGVLSPADVAAIAGTQSALPGRVRDTGGRWRQVLALVRDVGGPSPQHVAVGDALRLVEDDERELAFRISLTAVGVASGEDVRLSSLRCVVGADGVATRPPAVASPDVLVDGDVDTLFDALALGRRLHPQYATSQAGQAVREWLTHEGALLPSPTVEQLLQRLAAFGDSDNRVAVALDDDRLRALRDAFEALSASQREALGPGVGRAVLVDAVRYGDDGKPRRLAASPAEAYVIEHDVDSWHVAAARTPGLTWLDRRHVETLRRARGETGLGAHRLFSLLGAQRAPRLTSHPLAWQRFKNRPLGVRLSHGTERRRRTLLDRGATHTLHDHVSPDLQAVLSDLARDKDSTRRRKRANAVIATLARAWPSYGDMTVAEAVDDSGMWIVKGEIPASWLFDASTIAWMPNGSGTACAPESLLQRTTVNAAHYGNDRRRYAHTDMTTQQTGRAAVLTALGVTGDPPASQLVGWLVELSRNAPNGSDQCRSPETAARASAIYEALAATQQGTSYRATFGDLAVSRLRDVFGRGDGLVLTNVGWRRPSTVLVGTAVFGPRRPFALPGQGLGRLWQALGMASPTARDARQVLSEIAAEGRDPTPETHVVMMESWRLLARLGLPTDGPSMRLNRLPLWTSKGWSRRPVFAVTDPDLSAGLSDLVPVWLPGGAVDHYSVLFDALDMTRVGAAAAQVVVPDEASVDDAATELFSVAVRHLQADLAVDDAAAEASLRVPWPSLTEFNVVVAPDLQVKVVGVAGLDDPLIDVPAFADVPAATLYVRDTALAGRVEGGGRALASLSTVPARRVAYAWRAAWDKAEDRRAAELVRVARLQEEERAAAAAQARTGLQEFARGVAQSHQRSVTKGKASAKRSQADIAAKTSGRAPRNLIDTDRYGVRNPQGQHHEGTPPATSSGGGRRKARLRPPDLLRTRQRGPGRGPTNYTPEEKESAGLELVMLALASDRDDIRDIRDQRGVGADAIDGLRRFFELKVHAGQAPDEVALTESEVQRAAADDQFFLAVVSNVEEGRGTPEVRFYLDPLKTVGVRSSTALRIGPLSAAPSVGYSFEQRGA